MWFIFFLPGVLTSSFSRLFLLEACSDDRITLLQFCLSTRSTEVFILSSHLWSNCSKAQICFFSISQSDATPSFGFLVPVVVLPPWMSASPPQSCTLPESPKSPRSQWGQVPLLGMSLLLAQPCALERNMQVFTINWSICLARKPNSILQSSKL